MDSSKSRWNKYVEDKNIFDTTKMFYSKYPYKAEIKVSGAWMLHNRPSKPTLEYYQKIIKERQEKYKKSGAMTAPDSWFNLRQREIMDVEAPQIYAIAKMRKESNDIRFRVEGSMLYVYTFTADTLEKAIDTLELGKIVKDIWRPPVGMPELDPTIIYSKYPKHKFKVTMREGKYSAQVKSQISSYLKSFPLGVSMSPNLRTKLEGDKDSYMSGYYFIDDEQILPFLRMISPNFVKNIFHIKQL
jgi:hypothetical protein